MTERQSEIRRLASLPAYLTEIEVLIGRSVSPEALLSAQETALLRDKLKQIPKDQIVRTCIPFEARKSSAFAAMIDSLSIINGSPVVLWLPKSNDCGPLPLPSLSDINFAFPFNLIPEGILVVATSDGLNRMLLDFSDEDDGHRSLEVELHGPHWAQAKPPTPDSLPSTPCG